MVSYTQRFLVNITLLNAGNQLIFGKEKKIETVFQDTAITVFLNHVFVIPSFLHIVKIKMKKNHLDREFPRKHKTYTLNSYNSVHVLNVCFQIIYIGDVEIFYSGVFLSWKYQ